MGSPNAKRRSRIGRGGYGKMLKRQFDWLAFQNSGRAERHEQYLREQAEKKAARVASK